VSQALTDAIHGYLMSTPVDQRWGEGNLHVKAEIYPSGESAVLFLSTAAGHRGGREFLDRAAGVVRGGFERGEIEGFAGRMDAEPEQVFTHNDEEAGQTLLTLAIGIELAEKPHR
jgi:hypothetical protein